MADQLGVQPDAINFVSGDSATLASGGGTHSDRSMRLAGSLMVETSRTVIDKARRIAAAMLEVTAGDISFTDGLFMAAMFGGETLKELREAQRLGPDNPLPSFLAAQAVESIAREITGTKWNGWVFFGLKNHQSRT